MVSASSYLENEKFDAIGLRLIVLNAYTYASITNGGLPPPIGREDGWRMLIAIAGRVRALVAVIVG